MSEGWHLPCGSQNNQLKFLNDEIEKYVRNAMLNKLKWNASWNKWMNNRTWSSSSCGRSILWREKENKTFLLSHCGEWIKKLWWIMQTNFQYAINDVYYKRQFTLVSFIFMYFPVIIHISFIIPKLSLWKAVTKSAPFCITLLYSLNTG